MFFKRHRAGFTPFQILKDSDRPIDSHKKFGTGFTLTELLIVVIIIGILSTLALPMLVKALEKAKLGEAVSNLNLIRTGEKIYFLENGFFSGDAVNKTAGIDALNIENPNDITNNYFEYTVESDVNSTDFTARAQRKPDAPDPYNTYYYDIGKNGTISKSDPLAPSP